MANLSSLGQKDSDKKSKLAHVRAKGSSKSAAKTWLLTRVLFAFSVPLSVYVIASMLAGNFNSYEEFVSWVSVPFNSTVLILYLVLFTWYGLLETIEMLEDYVIGSAANLISKMLTKGFFGFIVILGIISILYTMFRA
ncbi:succinate dehydrogenase, hydrophobic membrane anchor protein [Rickettsiales bacterium LUAb2]